MTPREIIERALGRLGGNIYWTPEQLTDEILKDLTVEYEIIPASERMIDAPKD